MIFEITLVAPHTLQTYQQNTVEVVSGYRQKTETLPSGPDSFMNQVQCCNQNCSTCIQNLYRRHKNGMS